MKRLLVLLASFFVCASVGANDLAPDLLVKTVTNEVLDIVRNDKDIRTGNTQKTLELVEAKVLPHFNFQHMTRSALGREAPKVSPEQMATLIGEFRNLLVRTYSSALTQYRNQQVLFKPFKPDSTRPDEATVLCEIKQSGAPSIALAYDLEKTPTGWKVYDMYVAGASLVISNRDFFIQTIREDGVDGLIRRLQAKNKAAEPPAKSK